MANKIAITKRQDEKRAYTHLTRLFPWGHFQRLESWTGTGIFDVNLCLNGIESWIECKEAKDVMRDTTKIKCKVQRSQIPWETRRRQCGGRTYVALMVGERFYLIRGSYLADLKKGVTRKWLEGVKLDPNVLGR